MSHVKRDSAGAGQPFLSNAAASSYGILLIVNYNARSRVRYNRTDNLFQTCGPATHMFYMLDALPAILSPNSVKVD